MDSKTMNSTLTGSEDFEGFDASITKKALEPSEQSTVIHGIPLLLFTMGMMTIVFLMCLDHYILGTSQFSMYE